VGSGPHVRHRDQLATRIGVWAVSVRRQRDCWLLRHAMVSASHSLRPRRPAPVASVCSCSFSPSLAHIGAARADSFWILQRCSSLCFFSSFQILQLSGFFRACLPPGRAPQLQLPLFASPACVGAWPPTAKIDPHAWLSGYARGRFLRAVHATHNGPLVSWRSGLLARLLNKWQNQSRLRLAHSVQVCKQVVLHELEHAYLSLGRLG
jgi:hypothetical protein